MARGAGPGSCAAGDQGWGDEGSEEEDAAAPSSGSSPERCQGRLPKNHRRKGGELDEDELSAFFGGRGKQQAGTPGQGVSDEGRHPRKGEGKARGALGRNQLRVDDFLLGGADLWDPVEEDRERKRRKKDEAKWKHMEVQGAGAPGGAVSSSAPAPPGVLVMLHGLQKAPSLNGRLGTMQSGRADQAAGRVSVFLKGSGEEKKVRVENVLELETGKLGRLKGLQGAPELNGALCEFGDYDLAAGRYTIVLEGGEQKKIKRENLEVVRKVSTRRTTVTRSEVEAFDGKPPFRDAFVAKELPVPTLLKASLLAESCREASAKEAFKAASVSGRDVPSRSRIVAISYLRHAAIELPSREEELAKLKRRIVRVAEAFARLETSREVFLLVPGCVAKAFPCAQTAVANHFPYYIKICSELVLLEEPASHSKAWTRLDLLFATFCNIPVYAYGGDGEAELKIDVKESAWLLSERREVRALGPPADGQCLPGAQAAAARGFGQEFRRSAASVEAEVYVLG